MAYSKGLRTQVVDAYSAKEGSIVAVGKRFRVGISTVVKWINRQGQGLVWSRDTGVESQD
jgi:transposase